MKILKQYLLKSKEKLSKNNKGFSLIEIITAVSIISLVATMSTEQMDNLIPTARDAQRKANIHQIQTALNIYYNDHGEYPSSLTAAPTQESWEKVKTALEGEDPLTSYMPEVPVDPLNTDHYVFKYWSNGQAFKLVYETEDQFDDSPIVVWGL